MEALEKVLEHLCDNIERENDLEKKAEYVAMMTEAAKSYVAVSDSEARLLKNLNDKEIELAKLKATEEAHTENAVIKDRELKLEERKLDIEEAKVTAEETKVDKDRVVRLVTGVTAGVTGVSTIALGLIGLKQKADIFGDIMTLEGLDKVPISKSFDLFSKKEI